MYDYDYAHNSGNWGLEVFMAMSKEQAAREGRVVCMEYTLPGSDKLYFMLDEIPEEMCISKELGWEKKVCMTKKNFLLLAQEWGLPFFPPYSTFFESVEGDNIWLIGFGG